MCFHSPGLVGVDVPGVTHTEGPTLPHHLGVTDLEVKDADHDLSELLHPLGAQRQRREEHVPAHEVVAPVDVSLPVGDEQLERSGAVALSRPGGITARQHCVSQVRPILGDAGVLHGHIHAVHLGVGGGVLSSGVESPVGEVLDPRLAVDGVPQLSLLRRELLQRGVRRAGPVLSPATGTQEQADEEQGQRRGQPLHTASLSLALLTSTATSLIEEKGPKFCYW